MLSAGLRLESGWRECFKPVGACGIFPAVTADQAPDGWATAERPARAFVAIPLLSRKTKPYPPKPHRFGEAWREIRELLLKLRKVELIGFKSFCEKTHLTFSG